MKSMLQGSILLMKSILAVHTASKNIKKYNQKMIRKEAASTPKT